jgi:hypothetical protein
MLYVLLISSFMVSKAYGGTGTSAVFTIGQQAFTLNGEEKIMDVTPYISEGRTFMPVRYVAYALGITDDNILWNGDSQTVTLFNGDKTVKLEIGSNTMQVNDQLIIMDVSPQIAGGRTMLPIGHVASAFGARIDWNAASQTITLLNGTVEKLEVQPFGFDDVVIMGIEPKMSEEELFALLGKPLGVQDYSYEYSFGTVEVFDGKVYGLNIDYPGYKGPRDIQVGDSLESVLAKFPGGLSYNRSGSVVDWLYEYSANEAYGSIDRTDFKDGTSLTQVNYSFEDTSSGVYFEDDCSGVAYEFFVEFRDDKVEYIQLTLDDLA